MQIKALILALGTALLSTLSAQAGDLGIKFDQIKPGTQFFYYDKRQKLRWMTQYVGQSGGQHITRSYFVERATQTYTRHYRTRYYDSRGRLVRIDSPSFNHFHVFAPFDCLQSGAPKCVHKMSLHDLRTGKRKWTQVKRFEIRQRGDTLNVVKNANGNRLKERLKLDKNNMVIQLREPKDTFSQEWDRVKVAIPRD